MVNIECPHCKQQIWVDRKDDVIVMCGRYSHITERELNRSRKVYKEINNGT